ncbi:MAG: carbamoyl phosphate synthase large subunit [Dehalococcoidaceae bacterium]|nr:carbamoyl phosphate synthase large subunit [Dehalococcoidaceae bacterium]
MKKPKKVLIIGSGPIIIGQAAEFDYAGTQACKAMSEEGITSILVNSNPATIMTDEGIADITYIEPLTVESVTRIIKKERPDGLLPTLGGQTGLNLAVDLAEAGILDKYNVRLLGTPIKSIKLAEDRDEFRKLLHSINEPTPESFIVNSWKEAKKPLEKLGLPLVIRPAYTLGGTGGGIASTKAEYEQYVKSGVTLSPINQVLVEKALIGWKELEYEVMRDGNNTCITICNMENMDPMGVHTGDSIVIAPSQTLSDDEYQMLRTSALKIIRELGIEGGCNVQFALAPNLEVAKWKSDETQPTPYHVIEVNPRVSRSSALASKVTGYPIARVAAKIAVGKRLDEIINSVTKKTSAAFEPVLDYCVIKIPRWPFDKFHSGDRNLGTQMKATGEIMAIGRDFPTAFQKAIRSLELGKDYLWKADSDDKNQNYLGGTDLRLWEIINELRKKTSVKKIMQESLIDPWFITQIKKVVDHEREIKSFKKITKHNLLRAKQLGFSDRVIGHLTNNSAEKIRALRKKHNIKPIYKMVDTCAGEFDAATPYFYSSYEQENEAQPIDSKRMVVIGSGPIRIGQGIEFDYCSVQAAQTLKKLGVDSIMVNSNPETVSTDFDTSNRLYFEPLDDESIFDLLENEKNKKSSYPETITQFGGQTAVNLAKPLTEAGYPIAGSSFETIDLAEDRGRFEKVINELGIPQPPGQAVNNLEDALSVAEQIGYPVLVRPSYVLGGQGMEVVSNANQLIEYVKPAIKESSSVILIDKYLEGLEIEVDAVCDGKQILIPGIMEHIEKAGVHSGDSMAVYPPQNISEEEINTIVKYTTLIGKKFNIKGLMNIQYVVAKNEQGGSDVFIIELNPRSSRTVPFISKVTGIPLIELSVKVMRGKSLKSLGYGTGLFKSKTLVAIKAPVFSMSKLIGVDNYLGPEMKSTGEVMGVDDNFSKALTKSLIAANISVKPKTSFLLSISNQKKSDAIPLIRDLHKLNCELYATSGTAELIHGLGIPVITVKKIETEEDIQDAAREGKQSVVDVINDGLIGAVINTLEGNRPQHLRDGFQIRKAATEKQIPCFTSLDTAIAAIRSLKNPGNYSIKPLIEYRDK